MHRLPDSANPGVYVHIPFCLGRCIYCSFVTNPYDAESASVYVRALCNETELRVRDLEHRTVDSVYFGGGTPSLLTPDLLNAILGRLRSCFSVEEDSEITLEVNPLTADPSRVQEFRKMGINRVSLGLQSFDDDELRAMGRLHTTKNAVNAYNDLRKAGFDNISLDLLAGFPGQTGESVARSLSEAIALCPEHLSIYLLEIKSGTVLEKLIAERVLQLPEEDLVADMYEDICATAAAAGFEQYEISNFARGGKFSRHNLKYWSDRDYVGLGTAAAGLLGNLRYTNIDDLRDYVRAANSGDSPQATACELAPQTRFKDALIMGLRLVQGVDLGELSNRYGLDARHFVMQTVGHLTDAGLLILTENRLKLTDRGRLLSNIVFSAWV